MRTCVRRWLLGAASMLLAGCATTRYVQEPSLQTDLEQVMDDMDLLPSFPEPLAWSGSLWSESGPGSALFRDPRAFRLNDLLTIELEERDLGTNQSSTDLSRSADYSYGAGIAFGLEDPDPQPGQFSLNQVLSSTTESEFSGDGTTRRANTLDATITTRVLRVLPNGDLVIAGQKTVTINRERQVLTLVGSVRAVDVRSNNHVASSAVGNLTVRFWGRGEIDATIRQGWFMRVLNRLWPF